MLMKAVPAGRTYGEREIMKNGVRAIVVFSCIAFATNGSAPADEKVDYLKQIKPILSAKCFSCHGALKQEAALRLETLALMLEGGDSGEAIVATIGLSRSPFVLMCRK